MTPPVPGQCAFDAEPGEVVAEAAAREQLDRAAASPKLAGHTELWRA
jgi:hypothetical protein